MPLRDGDLALVQDFFDIRRPEAEAYTHAIKQLVDNWGEMGDRSISMRKMAESET